MAIITLFSGPYCSGDEVAQGVADHLGYQRVDEEVLVEAAKRSKLTVDKLKRSLSGSPGFLGKFTKEHERALAYLRAALADMLHRDNLVLHGYVTHLIPLSITHVLKICLIANTDYRVEAAMKAEGISKDKALKKVHEGDNERGAWTHRVRSNDPYDDALYDIVLAMQSTSIEQAIDSICSGVSIDTLNRTPEDEQAMADFALASEVNIALAEKGYEIDVKADNGNVQIFLNKYTSRLEHTQKKIEEIAVAVAGVQSAACSPGIHFTPPSLMPTPELNMPSRILLVDDEKEFVHTLSERLLTRDLESAVVYDGEEALDFVANEPPDVMVLDLKMPGIDGIEVLRRVKQSHPDIEVIILTGHGSDRERDIALDLGAFAYLQKPVNIDVLATKMKEAQAAINEKKHS